MLTLEELQALKKCKYLSETYNICPKTQNYWPVMIVFRSRGKNESYWDFPELDIIAQDLGFKDAYTFYTWQHTATLNALYKRVQRRINNLIK